MCLCIHSIVYDLNTITSVMSTLKCTCVYMYAYVRIGFFVPDNTGNENIPLAEVVVDHQNYPISSNAFVQASQVQSM